MFGGRACHCPRFTDTQILDEMEKRGVDKIYFRDGTEINPASQNLRSTISWEIMRAQALSGGK
jgi:hypothetical protein